MLDHLKEEKEVLINNELVQRYWISLKKGYANRYIFKNNMIYKKKSIESDEFTGNICYYKFKSVNKKSYISNGFFLKFFNHKKYFCTNIK